MHVGYAALQGWKCTPWVADATTAPGAEGATCRLHPAAALRQGVCNTSVPAYAAKEGIIVLGPGLQGTRRAMCHCARLARAPTSSGSCPPPSCSMKRLSAATSTQKLGDCTGRVRYGSGALLCGRCGGEQAAQRPAPGQEPGGGCAGIQPANRTLPLRTPAASLQWCRRSIPRLPRASSVTSTTPLPAY